MSNHKIINSIGTRNKIVVERADSCSCKHYHKPIKSLGYSDTQRRQLLEILRELKTTC